ncbi:hypothetical protein POM88_028527 [Heracleum sosnowskyi]|uniref:Uncharacterized protein n=1 Tax=Heracleum sosnowskyi TaxID=360622 RepID=A0AAD8MGU3_9APIA|nr:hypothetical protein POM88_028527 [Heracleum sosnowskyi]
MENSGTMDIPCGPVDRSLLGDTGGADSHVRVSTPRPVEHVMEEVETSCPTTSVEAPVHVSPPRPVEHVMEEVETSCPTTSVEAPVHVSPSRPVEHVMEEVEKSCPTTSVEAPIHVSPPRPVEHVMEEVETSCPPTSVEAHVHVSPPRHVVPVIEEIMNINCRTSGPTTSLEAPVHVSPPRHVEPVVQELENGDHTTSLQTPKAFKLPSSSPGTLGSTPAAFNTRGFFDVGYSGDLPIQLADVLELDTATDKFLDSHRRGGKKGDLTRPLKERKTRWLFNHWWTGTFGESDGNFIWYDHTGGRKCVTYQPTHEHLWTLAVDRWLLDDIVNTYAELLAIREVKLWNLKELQRPALQYFFAASYFMPWAGSECTNLSVPPDVNKTPKELDSMDKFIQQYQKQLHGKPIHLCDVAFFPVCTRLGSGRVETPFGCYNLPISHSARVKERGSTSDASKVDRSKVEGGVVFRTCLEL